MPGKLSTLVACNAIDFVIFSATQAIQERQLVDIEAYLSRLARIRGLSCTTYSTLCYQASYHQLFMGRSRCYGCDQRPQVQRV